MLPSERYPFSVAWEGFGVAADAKKTLHSPLARKLTHPACLALFPLSAFCTSHSIDPRFVAT